jgi:hypothetical protein
MVIRIEILKYFLILFSSCPMETSNNYINQFNTRKWSYDAANTLDEQIPPQQR